MGSLYINSKREGESKIFETVKITPKNKKILLFGGIGAALGAIVLFMTQGDKDTQLLSGAGTSTLYPEGGGGGGDIAEMLGSVQSSFIETMGNYDKIQSQRTAVLLDYFNEQSQTSLDLMTEITNQMFASQESMARKYEEMILRIEDMQAIPQQIIYQQPPPTKSGGGSTTKTATNNIYSHDGNYYDSYEAAGKASQKEYKETGKVGGGGVTKDFYEKNKDVFTPEEKTYYETAFGMR